MRQAFFPTSTLIHQGPNIPRRPLCESCKLYKGCQSPKMPPSGKGKGKILIVAEAPGKNEDEQGVQLVGNSGQEIVGLLRKVGIDMRRDCLLDNAIICRPPNNRTPTEKEIGFCRPHIVKTIETFKPEKILLLGGVAIKSVIGEYLWQGGIGKDGVVARWVGWQIPSQKINAWVCPTYHPSFLLRDKRPQEGEFLKNEVLRHLKDFAELDRRPWDKVPKWVDEIECILDDKKAASIIYKMIEEGGDAAWDLETNMLKPEHEDAEIVCCSICFKGRRTIAFPWRKYVRRAMKEFLQSKRIRTIASNLKFEDRWIGTIEGYRVRNWKWCTVNGAHVCDCRKDINSIKFQAFVHLGFGTYNKHIESLLSARGSYDKNRINEIDLDHLLKYNGLDSLLEYKVSKIQRRYLHCA